MKQSVTTKWTETFEVVSDDEVEVDLLDINSFMNLTVNSPANLPVEHLPREPKNLSTPTTGANMAMPVC